MEDILVFSDICTDFLAYIRHERGLSERTVDTYAAWLSTYRRWADGEGVGDSLADRYNTTVLRRYLYNMSQRGLRPRTIRNAFAPLKTLGVFLVEHRIIAESPVNALKLPKKDAPHRPVVSSQEVVALLEATDRLRPSRRRSLARAMLMTLALCGLRFSELLDLRVGDVRLDLRTLTVVHGKGEKSRTLHPAPLVQEALAEWLRERERIGAKHDWLWAYDTRRRMGEIGTRELLEEVKAIAGVGGHKHIVPHAFRRFFATALASQSGIQAASKALGHCELQTTLMYLSMQGEPARAMQGLDQALDLPQNDSRPRVRNGAGDLSPAHTSQPTRAADALSRRRRIPAGGAK